MEHMKVYSFDGVLIVYSKGFNRYYHDGKLITAIHGSPKLLSSKFKLLNIKNEEDLTAHTLAQQLLGG
jgi:hypothetical protein